MPMNNRLMVPRQTLHPEALAWRSAAIANGGTPSGAEVNALSTLIKSVYAAGLRDRFYRANFFIGGFGGALVPVFRGPVYGGTTYGTATDTNINFVAGDYSATGGLTGNGTTKYLNTGYPGNTLAASNAHMGLGYYGAETAAAAGFPGHGVWNNASHTYGITMRSSAATTRCTQFFRYGTASDTAGDNVGTGGSILATGRIFSSYPSFYRNGAASGTTATTSSNHTTSGAAFIFATSVNGVSAVSYSASRLAWYSLGAGLTAAQVLTLDGIIAAFDTALGRS